MTNPAPSLSSHQERWSTLWLSVSDTDQDRARADLVPRFKRQNEPVYFLCGVWHNQELLLWVSYTEGDCMMLYVISNEKFPLTKAFRRVSWPVATTSPFLRHTTLPASRDPPEGIFMQSLQPFHSYHWRYCCDTWGHFFIRNPLCLVNLLSVLFWKIHRFHGMLEWISAQVKILGRILLTIANFCLKSSSQGT